MDDKANDITARLGWYVYQVCMYVYMYISMKSVICMKCCVNVRHARTRDFFSG